MSAVEARPFVIPSTADLGAAAHTLREAADYVEELELALLHATGAVVTQQTPALVRFAERPSAESIGALWIFAADARGVGESLVEWAAKITDLLEDVAVAYRDWEGYGDA